MAFAINEGLLPYRDVFTIRPPMTLANYWVAQQLFGPTQQSIRLLDIFFVAAGASALSHTVVLLGGGFLLGVASGLFFVSFTYTQNFWSLAQSDLWASIVCIFAVNFLLLGLKRHQVGYLSAAGAAFGLAFWYKYTIAPVALLVFLPLFVRNGLGRLSRFALAAFVIGGLSILAAGAGLLAAAGILDSYIETQTYALDYRGVAGPGNDELVERGWRALSHEPLNQTALVIGAGLLGLAVRKPESRALSVFAVVWFLLGGISAIGQGKGFAYHYASLFPGASIIAAFGVVTPLRYFHDRLTSTAAFALAFLVAAAAVSHDSLQYSWSAIRAQFSEGETVYPSTAKESRDFSPAAIEAAHTALGEILQPGDDMFIWGYEASLYYLSKRAPKHRYPFVALLIASYHDGRLSEDLLSRLKADPPEVILVQNGDSTPHVTGETGDSRELLHKVPEVKRMLEVEYELIRTVPRFEIYRRKPI